MSDETDNWKWCVETYGWLSVSPCRTRAEARELCRSIREEESGRYHPDWEIRADPHVAINPSYKEQG